MSSARVTLCRLCVSVGSQNSLPPGTEPSPQEKLSGCPTVVILTSEEVSVPWRVKWAIPWSNINAQGGKVAAIASLSPIRWPSRCGHSVKWATRAQTASAPSALGHDILITFGTALVGLVHSRKSGKDRAAGLAASIQC